MMPSASDPKLAAFQAARAQRIALARLDVNAFIEYVLKDEHTGAPVRQAPMHETWHRLADEHDRLVLWAHVESAKTANLTIGRTLWLLGRDPTLRVAIVSNTQTQAVKIVRTIAGYIERSSELHEVFPHLRPGKPWRETALTVERPTVSKDPSIQAFGQHGAILGSRLDLLVADDSLDYENTRTEEQRKTVREWFLSTLMGRIVQGGRVLVVGTAWHPEDLMHVLERQGWPAYRFPVTDEEGYPQWPERWSAERIAAKRLELGPAESARQLDVIARNDEEARFKEAWLSMALERGAGKTVLPHLLHVPQGCRVVHGVDLAVSKSSAADLTAFVTLLVRANGDRELLNVEAGRLHGPETVDRILQLHRRYGGVFVVESVAAQALLAQFLRKVSDVPVIDFKTGRNKMSLEWQAEAFASELNAGRWVIPCDETGLPYHPQVAELVKETLYYDPRSHCGDRLAALLFARWGAERGTRTVESFYIPWIFQR